MRVLQVHNYYRSSAPSGEDHVARMEAKLLRDNGHIVSEFSRFNDRLNNMGPLGTLLGAFSTPWNPFAARSVVKALDRAESEVVHVHNTFPQISPSIFSAISSRAARVLTLHNYRIVCPAALPTREGKVCVECIDSRSIRPSIRYGCYRDSRIATLPLAAKVSLHRGLKTWHRHIDAFIVLSAFQRHLMISGGFPGELIHIKPNFYSGNPAVLPYGERSKRMVFVGRLTAEKGVATLIDAWRRWGSSAPELAIIGDGELRVELERAATGLPIRFLGQVPHEVVKKELSQAKLIVVPSEWFEGFPMVLQEAFALGTPAAVSDIGALPLIVRNGAAGGVFKHKDPLSLLHELQTLWDDNAALEQKSSTARKIYESEYTEEKNIESLIKIYEAAMQINKERDA